MVPEASMVAMALLPFPHLNYAPAMGGGVIVIISLMGSLAIVKNS